MEIEKLIKHMRKEAQDYRAGRTLGRAFADAEDVLDEAAAALEQLQAENDRLKEEVQQMRWIPVEERLPEPGGLIVYANKYGNVVLYGVLRVAKNGRPNRYDYWAYLPELPDRRPPEGEEDNND